MIFRGGQLMPNLLSTLRSLAKDKLSVKRRENELLATLNRLLPSIGYKVVLTRANGIEGSTSQSVAARKSIACPHCDRSFAHPLHLGRHVSAMHRNGARHGRQVIKASKV